MLDSTTNSLLLQSFSLVRRVIAVTHVFALALAVSTGIARAALSPRCGAYPALIASCRCNFTRCKSDVTTLDLIDSLSDSVCCHYY